MRSAWVTGVGPGPEGDAGVIERMPVTDRLSIGGASSVRGYRESGIDDGGNGGRFLLNANFEARFPLKGFLSGALFVDAGNVWPNEWQMVLREVRVAAGAGLRYETPVGPIRFDFGYQLNRIDGLMVDGAPQERPWRLHFSIGQAF